MKKIKPIFIFIVLYFAYTSIYIARVNLSVATPELISLKVLDSAHIGFLGSCFFAVYAFGRIINGTISDTVAPSVMIATGLALVGVGNIFISVFPPYVGMLALWTVNAFAQSMLWSSVLCTVTAIYPPEKAKKKSSVMVSSVAVGNILGIIVNTYLVTVCGVRYAFAIPGVIAVIMGIITFIFIKHIKSPSDTVKKHISPIKLLKNRELLLMNIAAMAHGVMKENISLWMAVYIVAVYKVDLTVSAFYILLIPAIGFVGRLLYPVLSRFCNENENKISFISFGICIVFSIVLCLDKPGMLISVISLGMIYTAVSVINTSMLSIYPLRYSKTGNTASVSGIMDFSTYLGAGISSALYGTIIKYFGYMPMFVSWIIISLVSMFIILHIDKSRNKNQQNG